MLHEGQIRTQIQHLQNGLRCRLSRLDTSCVSAALSTLYGPLFDFSIVQVIRSNYFGLPSALFKMQMSNVQPSHASHAEYTTDDIHILRRLGEDLQLERAGRHATSWIDYADKIPSRYCPQLLPRDIRPHTAKGRLVMEYLTISRPHKCMVRPCGEVLYGFHAMMVRCFFSNRSRQQLCATPVMDFPALTFDSDCVNHCCSRRTKDRSILNASVQLPV